MSEKIPKVEMVTFNPGVVANRMELLAQIKPMAFETYMMQRRAGVEPGVLIDFSKPVSRERLSVLNSIFNIDAAIFFTVSDEELQNNQEMFLRPEED
jgi:hypothetical protein